MRLLAIAVLFLATAGLADGQTSIRQVDFKNFTYPRTGPLLGHDRMMWLGPPAKRQIRLRNGTDGGGFSLESVKFAGLTADAKEDAIVVLHYDTGGTQQTDYIYIYSLDSGKPKLLAYCCTGDRAASGLYSVYAQDGKLVVELNDTAKAVGLCCSTGFVRTRYRWSDGKFVASGPREFGPIKLQEYAPTGPPIP